MATTTTANLYRAAKDAGVKFAGTQSNLSASLWEWSAATAALVGRGESLRDIAKFYGEESLPRRSPKDATALSLVTLIDRDAWLAAWARRTADNGKAEQLCDRVILAAMTRLGKGGTEAVTSALTAHAAEWKAAKGQESRDALADALVAFLAPKAKRAAKVNDGTGSNGGGTEDNGTEDTAPVAADKILADMAAKLVAMRTRGEWPESEAALQAVMAAARDYVTSAAAAKGWGQAKAKAAKAS